MVELLISQEHANISSLDDFSRTRSGRDDVVMLQHTLATYLLGFVSWAFVVCGG